MNILVRPSSIRFAPRKLHRLQRVTASNRFRDGRVIRRSRGCTEGALILYRSRIRTSFSTIDQNQVNRWKFPAQNRWMSGFSGRFVPLDVATGMQLAKSSKDPYNEEVQVYELTGGVELVPLLTSRRYYSKGARHIATDATRPGYTIDSYVLSRNFSSCFQELHFLHFVCTSDFWFSFFLVMKVSFIIGGKKYVRYFFLMQFWKRCRRKKKGKRMNLGKWNVLHVDANTCKLENLLLPLNKFKYEWSSIWQNYN